MEFRYFGHEYHNSNHLPSKKIKTNEINNYFNNNFGFDRINFLS